MSDELRQAAGRLRRLESPQNMTPEDWDQTYGKGGGFAHDADDDYRLLARACLAERTWQPIETAPKDGTEILTARESGRREVARWNEAGDWACAGWGGPSWRFPQWDQPTHWMPLPAPPGAPAP